VPLEEGITITFGGRKAVVFKEERASPISDGATESDFLFEYVAYKEKGEDTDYRILAIRCTAPFLTVGLAVGVEKMEKPEVPPEGSQALELDWFRLENLALGDEHEAEFQIKYTDQEGFTISAEDRKAMGGKLHQLRLTQTVYTHGVFLQFPPSATDVQVPSVYYKFVVGRPFRQVPAQKKVEAVVKVDGSGEIEFTVPSGSDLYLEKMNEGSNTDAIFMLKFKLPKTAGKTVGNNQFRELFRRVSITELSNLEAKYSAAF